MKADRYYVINFISSLTSPLLHSPLICFDEYIGGIGGSLATFMIPAAIYMKLSEKSDRLFNIAACVLVIGFSFMIIVLVETALQFA